MRTHPLFQRLKRFSGLVDDISSLRSDKANLSSHHMERTSGLSVSVRKAQPVQYTLLELPLN